jgi:hypothetical protein
MENAATIKLQLFILLFHRGSDEKGIDLAEAADIIPAYNPADALYRAKLCWPNEKVLDALPWDIVPPPIRMHAFEKGVEIRDHFNLKLKRFPN